MSAVCLSYNDKLISCLCSARPTRKKFLRLHGRPSCPSARNCKMRCSGTEWMELLSACSWVGRCNPRDLKVDLAKCKSLNLPGRHCRVSSMQNLCLNRLAVCLSYNDKCSTSRAFRKVLRLHGRPSCRSLFAIRASGPSYNLYLCLRVSNFVKIDIMNDSVKTFTWILASGLLHCSNHIFHCHPFRLTPPISFEPPNAL